MYKRILVPLDGSKTAEGVLPHTQALANSEGAEIILLTVAANPVTDDVFSDPGIAQRVVQEQQTRNKKYIADLERQLRVAGFNVSTLRREGAVADMILHVAEELKVDVITMSSHGRTGPARWLLGSIADRVVRNSKVPVLLIRAQG